MAKSEAEEGKAAADAATAQAEAEAKAKAALSKSGKEKRITFLSIHTGAEGSINPGTTVDTDEAEADRLINLKAAVLAAEGAEVSNG